VPQIGPLEILVVAVVALIVFGPEKLPDLARKVGRTATELRRIANEAKAEFQTDFSVDDDDDEYAQSSSSPRTPRRHDGPRHASDDSEPEVPPAPASAEKAGSDDAGAADEGDGDSDAARDAG
jgi:sec-independent protein translocase protein TatB